MGKLFEPGMINRMEVNSRFVSLNVEEIDGVSPRPGAGQRLV